MAESLPTSVSAFNHRRARADSTASFSFYQEDIDERLETGEVASSEDLDELPFEDDYEDDVGASEVGSSDLERQAPDDEYVLNRRSSTQSRRSGHSRVLRRDSGVSASSGHGGNRTSQKVYMVNEDLYIAIAGFRTSTLGLAVYILICLLTFGVGWLLFRWIPRWHVKLVGRPSSLKDCQWVVIENSWNEMAILDVDSKPYGRVLSTVFGAPGKLTNYSLDEDHDPIIQDLRMINYRYVRFFYHPLKDKFILCNGWKDPLWTDVRAIRSGIDSEERSHRDAVFGGNLIDIEEKSTFRLLADEVRCSSLCCCGVHELTL